MDALRGKSIIVFTILIAMICQINEIVSIKQPVDELAKQSRISCPSSLLRKNNWEIEKVGLKISRGIK